MKITKTLWHTSLRRASQAALGLSTLLATQVALAVNDLPGGPAVNQINLHPPMSKIASELVWLHNFMLVICTLIFVGVFGVMFYSIFKHRRSRGARPANFHESVTVEIAWTVVPFLIVIGMALPATKAVVAMKDTTNADVTIKATGYQWKWGYDYLNGEGQGIAFLSSLDPSHRTMSDLGQPAGDDYLLKVDNPLVVPVQKKIRIVTTASDVIHAWMLPSMGVKQDAIPGFVRDAWFRAEREGDYYGQCAELCGKEHAYMPIHVKVVSQEAYTQWVEGKMKEIAARADDPNKTWELAALVERGEKVYTANCAACHRADGKGAGPIKPLDASQIVRDDDKTKTLTIVHEGAAAGAMPPWKGTLNDTEIAAVVTYIKNAWSNKTNQVVQPAESAALRR